MKKTPTADVWGTVDQSSRLLDQLLAWARHRIHPAVILQGLAPMPGNSGLSFGFDVLHGGVTMPLVIRLAPPGVRRRGNTDVLRLVPLIETLTRVGVPVARMVDQCGEESWFGTDAIIQERVEAAPLHMTDPSLSVAASDEDVTPYLQAAIAALVLVHQVDWQTQLPAWESPRSVEEEVQTWYALVDRISDPETREFAAETRDALVATQPQSPVVGLIHGDFQTNNVLFRPGTQNVVAIVDWELAGIGAQGLDLAWLSMMTDHAAWGPERRALMRVATDPSDLSRWYEQASGRAVEDFDWYRSLACYRFAVIASFNLGLHRKGRRVDETYERLASSIPTLFSRALALLRTA